MADTQGVMVVLLGNGGPLSCDWLKVPAKLTRTCALWSAITTLQPPVRLQNATRDPEGAVDAVVEVIRCLCFVRRRMVMPPLTLVAW